MPIQPLSIGNTFSAVVIDRQRFKQSILPSTFRCGTVGGVTPGNGGAVATGSTDVTFTDAGRKFVGTNIELYPDIGVALVGTPWWYCQVLQVVLLLLQQLL